MGPRLVTGFVGVAAVVDSSGYVTVWGIEGYAMVKEETEPPPGK